MYFNSLYFFVFLIIVFAVHWGVAKNAKTIQNCILLIASYFFYSCWDWRFLFLLIFSTALDFLSGIYIENAKSQKVKKRWFLISVFVNLGFLGIFKYYDFFASSFAILLAKVGLSAQPMLLNVIIPVGISFYTFHGLSYVIDVYYKRIKAELNYFDYALFVSYFPLLVAGPIERSTHLLPQIKVKRTFDFELAKQGIYQIIWGLVKKVVIADTCATYANAIFDNFQNLNSLSLILGAVYFAFQIYGDFSGYSDIALGVSKLFGIHLLKNFDYPYFSRDIAEFWRKWHISLSSWFRDYIYIPLGGSQGSKWLQIRNVFMIFLLSGFWHGANWTFLAWGFLNALYFLPLLLRNKNRKNTDSYSLFLNMQSFKILLQVFYTFTLTCFAWIFFRSKSISDAFEYITRIFENKFFASQYLENERYNYEILLLLGIFVLVEWRYRQTIEPISGKNQFIKIAIALASILALGTFSDYKSFIYFQF